ncbi:hypothetical protein F7725_015150 [Dissostichus mawsoni]|uniref:Uncharacterized protein n=1 Tax=Dissostichus mawsoni TaxID=36200 RepID=A0A7J5YHM2_DISMA|nr:hypothetical protein F7725_015150 [Dissostichus mawsoni]
MLPELRKYCGFSMTGIFVMPMITASGPISETKGVVAVGYVMKRAGGVIVVTDDRGGAWGGRGGGGGEEEEEERRRRGGGGRRRRRGKTLWGQDPH